MESKSISETGRLGHASLGVWTTRLHKDLVRGPYSVDTWAGIRPGKATRGPCSRLTRHVGMALFDLRTNSQLINFKLKDPNKQTNG